MAGHSKGDGQKPTGIYVPNKQVTGRDGTGGSTIRPVHVQQELQAISNASRVLRDRLNALQEVVGAAGDIDGRLDSLESTVNPAGDIDGRLDTIEGWGPGDIGAANANHNHSVSDVVNLTTQLGEAQKIPSVRGFFYDTDTQSGGGGWTMSSNGWQGMFPVNMFEPGTTKYFGINSSVWNGTRSLVVHVGGWYILLTQLDVAEAVTQGVGGSLINFKKYDTSAQTWYTMMSSRIAPIDANYSSMGLVIDYISSGSTIVMGNENSNTIKYNTWSNVSHWALLKLA
jgi:hypothetical protein